MKKICCFGEMLWDELPTGALPGGAPMNVALRLRSFGDEAVVISKVGNDDRGDELVQLLSDSNVDTSLIQNDTNLQTGKVTVTLNEAGNASYSIVQPVAWDAISLTKELIDEVNSADFFVFGSLVTRDERSKSTLDELLKHAPVKIFDVNLRAPFYTSDSVFQYMMQADIIKLNDEELYLLMQEKRSSKTEKDLILSLATTTKTEIICVTRGDRGALLFANGNFFEHPGFKVSVVDTIGAGDSFLATFIHLLGSKTDFQTIITKSCAVGALVARNKGANPKINATEIDELIAQYHV
ncbi:MAG: carbohydrate kinase [Fluviicola sp.]|nr:carbohydrate kinase [Fluviicola sp.]MBP6272825.1 carbohydrate kinase [Fluviicola sp.]